MRAFVSSGFSTAGTLNSASAVPPCMMRKVEVEQTEHNIAGAVIQQRANRATLVYQINEGKNVVKRQENRYFGPMCVVYVFVLVIH